MATSLDAWKLDVEAGDDSRTGAAASAAEAAAASEKEATLEEGDIRDGVGVSSAGAGEDEDAAPGAHARSAGGAAGAASAAGVGAGPGAGSDARVVRDRERAAGAGARLDLRRSQSLLEEQLRVAERLLAERDEQLRFAGLFGQQLLQENAALKAAERAAVQRAAGETAAAARLADVARELDETQVALREANQKLAHAQQERVAARRAHLAAIGEAEGAAATLADERAEGARLRAERDGLVVENRRLAGQLDALAEELEHSQAAAVETAAAADAAAPVQADELARANAAVDRLKTDSLRLEGELAARAQELCRVQGERRALEERLTEMQAILDDARAAAEELRESFEAQAFAQGESMHAALFGEAGAEASDVSAAAADASASSSSTPSQDALLRALRAKLFYAERIVQGQASSIDELHLRIRDEGSAVRQGWLLMQGTLLRWWNRRWVVLSADCLFCSKSEDGGASSMIPLAGAALRVTGDVRFAVLTTGRAMRAFEAQDVVECKEWTRAIESCIRRLAAQSPRAGGVTSPTAAGRSRASPGAAVHTRKSEPSIATVSPALLPLGGGKVVLSGREISVLPPPEIFVHGLRVRDEHVAAIGGDILFWAPPLGPGFKEVILRNPDGGEARLESVLRYEFWEGQEDDGSTAGAAHTAGGVFSIPEEY